MSKQLISLLCTGALTASVVLVPSPALADDDAGMRGEESFRSFPQLMMRDRANTTNTLADQSQEVADKFEKDMVDALGLWRYEIVDYGESGPEILQWCDKITSDLQTYRQELDYETDEAELTIEAKEFQCSEAYSYTLAVTHECDTTGTAGDATTTRRAICTVDATISFSKFRARFDGDAKAAFVSDVSTALTDDEAPVAQRGRMIWSAQSDWGKGGSIKIHARDQQRVVIKPGEQDKALDEALEWALVTVLSKAAGLLNDEPDLKPKAMVQNKKGDVCLSKDIVKLDSPFALYDDKGAMVGFMKAREIHDGCMLTPSIEAKVRAKRRRNIKMRERLNARRSAERQLDRLGENGKEIDADVDDEDWDQGAMLSQVITGTPTNKFGMGYLAQELPFSGWTVGVSPTFMFHFSGGDSVMGGGGVVNMEYSLAQLTEISEFHVYGQLGITKFLGEEQTTNGVTTTVGPGLGIDFEGGVLKRIYVAGPLFVDVGGGLAAGYYLDNDGSLFAGGVGNLGIGFTFSPAFGIRLKAGYRAGLFMTMGDTGESGFGHGVTAGLNLNMAF